MKTKLFALILCLTLLVTSTALAAPTRDPRRSEITVTDTLQCFLNLTMGAAVLKDVTHMQVGEAPSQSYVEGVFGIGLYSLILPYEGDDIWDNRAILTEEELQALYGMVFAVGSYSVPEKAECDCIKINGKDVAFDLSPLGEIPAVGVYVYDSAFDGSNVTLYADLFTYYGILSTDPGDLPDDAMTWLCGAEINLKSDGSAPYGYLLSGFSLTDTYMDGKISEWVTTEHDKMEISLTAPSIFGLADRTDTAMTFQTSDGTATITVKGEKIEGLSFDEYLAAYTKDNAGKAVVSDKDFLQFVAQSDGEYVMHMLDEDAGMAYSVVIEFPVELTEEFTLYGEFIRNSFAVWSLANG